MITGIGTPTSHNNNPRPIFCLHINLRDMENVEGMRLFRQ